MLRACPDRKRRSHPTVTVTKLGVLTHRIELRRLKKLSALQKVLCGGARAGHILELKIGLLREQMRVILTGTHAWKVAARSALSVTRSRGEGAADGDVLRLSYGDAGGMMNHEVAAEKSYEDSNANLCVATPQRKWKPTCKFHRKSPQSAYQLLESPVLLPMDILTTKHKPDSRLVI